MKKDRKRRMGKLAAMAAGAILGIIYFGNTAEPFVEKKNKDVVKLQGYYKLLMRWCRLKQDNQSLETFFLDRGYHSIAVYGMGELGKLLYNELKSTDIRIRYAVDKNPNCDIEGLRIIDIGRLLEEEPVDAVIVTATFDFGNIYDELKNKMKCPIISLEDVV